MDVRLPGGCALGGGGGGAGGGVHEGVIPGTVRVLAD